MILITAYHHAVMDSFCFDACLGRCGNLQTTIEPLNNGGIEYRWMSPPTVTLFCIRSDPETGGERINAATKQPREDGTPCGLMRKSGQLWHIDRDFLGDL